MMLMLEGGLFLFMFVFGNTRLIYLMLFLIGWFVGWFCFAF